MATEYKDVLRVFQGESGLPGTIRNKQLGFESDGLNRLAAKDAGGTIRYWTPDGATGINATSVEYVNPSYAGLSNVGVALDYVLAETGVSVAESVTGIQGTGGSDGWALIYDEINGVFKPQPSTSLKNFTAGEVLFGNTNSSITTSPGLTFDDSLDNAMIGVSGMGEVGLSKIQQGYGSVTIQTGSGGNPEDHLTVNAAGTTTITTASGTSHTLVLTSGSSTGNPYMSITQAGTERARLQYLDASDKLEYSNYYGPLAWSTGGAGSATERVEITSGGQVFMFDLSGSTGESDARYNTSTGELFYDTSSLRYKENIKISEPEDTSWLLKVPVSVYDRVDGSKKDEIGIIAEDLAEVKPDMVCYNKKGEVESYSKSDLVPILLAELQRLNKRVEELEKKLSD